MAFGEKTKVLDPRYNDMFTTLFQGFMPYATSATDYTASMDDTVIEITANEKVILPAAAAANKGKFFVVYFSANAKTGGGIVDDKSSPTAIVAQALCLNESSFLVVSNGTAWIPVPMALGTDA
jgi:hypothetical protein